MVAQQKERDKKRVDKHVLHIVSSPLHNTVYCVHGVENMAEKRKVRKEPRPDVPKNSGRAARAGRCVGVDSGEKVTRLFISAMALLVSNPEKFLSELRESFAEVAGNENARLMWSMEYDKGSRNMKIEQAEIITASGDERLLPLIEILAENEDAEIRMMVAENLEDFPNACSLSIVSRLIADEDDGVRKAARETLYGLKKKGLNISRVFSPALPDEKPLHSCWINKAWREIGIASIVIARETSPDTLKFACFLVDRWGLGLKDVFGNLDFPKKRFLSEVLPMYKLSGQKLVPFDIATARKLIWGAVDYVRKNGFREPADFKYWKDLPGVLREKEASEPVLASDGLDFFLCE
jgi:hypothetical protein